jgi:hypothetical protein
MFVEDLINPMIAIGSFLIVYTFIRSLMDW